MINLNKQTVMEHLSYDRIHAKWYDTKQGTKYQVCLSKVQTTVEERGRGEAEREGKKEEGKPGGMSLRTSTKISTKQKNKQIVVEEGL